MRKQSELHLDLDSIVEAFEDAWSGEREPDVSDFLPSPLHPDGERIAAELLCLDLEFRHRRATSPEDLLGYYQQRFPDLMLNREILKQLAFEDYRWQLQHGRNVTRDEYAARLEISTDHWPAPPTSAEETNAVARGSTVQPGDELQRLSSAIQLLPDVGDTFQSFAIVDRLGEGQFGRVFLAEQKDLANRHVVLKLSTQLWNEADRLARLQHTNIVPIYSVHQSDGVQAVCMPFFGRHTLKGLLNWLQGKNKSKLSGQDLLEFACCDLDREGGRVQTEFDSNSCVNEQLAALGHEQTCLWIVAKIAAGIAHAHDRGILHRDIKPANVLLSTDAEPMVLDFNLSTEMTLDRRSSLLVGGTLPYMSPEHIRAVATGESTDTTSDIYSLGVILFQLLSGGQLPFQHRSGEFEVTVAEMLEDRLSLPTLQADALVSTSTRTIVNKCLSPNPKDRYQSAHQLREDIDRQLRDRPLRHCVEPTGVRLQKWLRRNPQIRSTGFVGGVAVVLLAIVATIAVLRGDRLADMRAIESYRNFIAMADEARAALSTPSVDVSLRDAAAASLQDALPIFDSASLSSSTDFLRLDPTQQKQVRQILTELHFVLSVDQENRASLLQGRERDDALHVALRENHLAQISASKPNWASLQQHAALLEKLGDKRKAQEVRTSSGTFDSDEIVDQYLASLQNIRDGKIRHGKDILTELTEKAPKNFMVWHLLGATQSSLGDLDAAEDCFTHCKAISPDSQLARFQRGAIRLEQNDFQGAKDDFDFVLRRSPDNAATLLSRAHAFRGLRDYKSAIEDLNASEKSGRYPTRVPLLRAKLWRRLGETRKADRDLQLGLNSKPTAPEGWVARGLAKLPDDIDGALADVKEALRLRPRYRVAQHNLAMILAEHVKDFDAALAVYNEMVHANPTDLRTLRSRAVLQARLGAAKEATADLAKVFAGDRSAQTYYQAACVYSMTSDGDQQKLTQAVTLLRKALQLDGATWLGYAKKDADLAAIRQQPEFDSLMAAMEAVFDQPQAKRQ